MDNSELLKALGSMTEEQKKALAQLLNPKEEKKKPTTEIARAQRVYFFRQLEVYETLSEKKKDDKIIKEVNQLPARVIAVDEKMAWRLYWKQRNKYQFLGSSNGMVWRDARNSGKSVSEAQAMEYEAMLQNPDMTPPESKEKTFFAGRTSAQLSRGQEISWHDGLKQGKI